TMRVPMSSTTTRMSVATGKSSAGRFTAAAVPVRPTWSLLRRTTRLAAEPAGCTNSQRRTVLSWLPDTKYLPSGENATELTASLCALMVRRHLPFATFQSRKVLSTLPDRTSLPSGENATEFTASTCPLKTQRHLPVADSHSRKVLSRLADTIRLPSDENATEVTWEL